MPKKGEKDKKKKRPPSPGAVPGGGNTCSVAERVTVPPTGGTEMGMDKMSELCGVGLDEEDTVVPFCIKAVEVGLDAWGQERPRKDEAKDDGLRLAGPDTCPTCKPGVMAGAIALAPLKAAHRTTFDLASMAVRCARLDAARRAL